MMPKKHPTFSPLQMRGVIKLSNGKIMHWNCFRISYKVTTALIGDSIVRDICINGVCAYSIPGGTIEDFRRPEVLLQLCPYQNIIVGSIGGNDLTTREGICLRNPVDVFNDFMDLVNLLALFVDIVMTVSQRFGGLSQVTDFNRLLEQSSALSTYKTRRKVHRLQCWEADKVHLTLSGRRDFCKAEGDLRNVFHFLPHSCPN